MSEMKLYEISDELLNVIDSEEFDETALNELVESFENKAAGIIAFNDSMQNFIEYCKSEEKRISSKRKAVENRGKSLMSYLKMCMESAEIMKLEVGTKTLNIQNNPPALVVDDESEIPAKYFTIIPEQKQLDKNTLKADLKKGNISGVHLDHGTRLVVK